MTPNLEKMRHQLGALSAQNPRDFLQHLQAYVTSGGDPAHFRAHLNQIFQTAYPQDGAGDAGAVAFIKRIYEKVAALPYPAGYIVSPHWDRKSKAATSIALQLQDPRHIVAFAQDGAQTGFDHRLIEGVNAQRHEIAATIDYKLRAIQDDHGVDLPAHLAAEDSPYTIPASVLAVRGKRYNTMFLTHAQFYLRIADHVGTSNIHRIMEIGGGYGALARLFHLQIAKQRKLQYVIVDLMGSLVFSYTFLRVNFPHASIVVVESAGTTAADLAGADFVLVPVQFMQAAKGLPFDLVINTMSMQEMSQPTVDILMDYIEHDIDPAYFYSFNYFLCLKQTYKETSGREDASLANLICPKIDSGWDVVFAKLNTPGLTVDSNSRNWLEIILKRDKASDPAREAAAHYEESQKVPVLSQAWVTHAVAAVFRSQDETYVRNFLDGIQVFFLSDDCGVPNNVYNVYNKIVLPSPERRQFIYDNVGEVIYFRRFLKT